MTLLEDLNLVTIDFETYYDSDYQLKKMTTESYVRDPRFEVIGVGVKRDGDPTPTWLEASQFARWSEHQDWANTAILCHHTHFDGFILSHHFGIKPKFWLDTLSMARALHGTEVGGSLGTLMEHYGVGVKGNEVHNAKGLRRVDFTDEHWLRYGEYCKTDVQGTYDIFWRMLEEGFPESELRLIDTTIRMFTEPKFQLNEPLVEQFIVDEAQRKQALLDRIGADRSVLMSNDKFAALLIELGEEPPQKISTAKSKKAGTEVYTWAFAKTDPGFQALLEHERDEIRWVAEARLGVKSTINETRATRILGMSKRGPLPVYLKYWGAHTGRWSGADKMNWQNLQRANERRPEVGTLRKAVQAPPGHVLVVADSSQIEARVLAWLAGHTELVKAFAEGRDVYSEFASEAYGRKVTKADKTERFVGKTCVLGLGYGMGGGKLAQTLLQGAMGGPPVQFTGAEAEALKVNLHAFQSDTKRMERVERMASRLPLEQRVVHCAIATEFVNRYRAINKPIPQLWRKMDELLPVIASADWSTDFGPLKIWHRRIGLPSGMSLKYPGMRQDEDGRFSYFNAARKKKVDMWGGTLTENVIQALARIIVADQMLTIFERYPIGTMTHDEIVAVVPESEGDTALEYMLQVMKTPPAWAPDLPVSAEGGVAVSYGDAK